MIDNAGRRATQRHRLAGLVVAAFTVGLTIGLSASPAWAAATRPRISPVRASVNTAVNTAVNTTASSLGYHEVASDGGIFSFGNAAFYGSMGGKPLNKPIVGMAATPDGKG
ncbi:MAG: hypothetical protein ACYCV5_07165, partial [Acidimicrobiales bacterium]